MKNVKKLIASILASFLILSNTSMLSTSAKEDTTTLNENVKGKKDTTVPTYDINSLKINKKYVHNGDTVTLSLKASDNESGIKDLIAYYNCVDENKQLIQKEFHLNYNAETKLYECTIYIDNDMARGTWYIDHISLIDKDSNNSWIFSGTASDLSSLNFHVNNFYSDTTAPVFDLDSLKVDKKTVHYGDTVTLSLSAYDNESGIKDIVAYYICIDKNNNFLQKELHLSYNPITKLYECPMYINNDIAKGTWYIDRINLIDNASNTSCISGTAYNLYSLNLYVK